MIILKWLIFFVVYPIYKICQFFSDATYTIGWIRERPWILKIWLIAGIKKICNTINSDPWVGKLK
jgi:hypothetical protein